MTVKVFCVGLHKTATMSISASYRGLGLRTVHSTTWSHLPLPNEATRTHDVFSDGGAHFWDPTREMGGNHPVRSLHEAHPGARFVLQTREMKPWVVSKMLHAGWTSSSTVVATEPPYAHDQWRTTSTEVVRAFVENRLAYHREAVTYLAGAGATTLVLDVTKDPQAPQKLADLVLPGRRLVERPRLRRHHRAVNRRRTTFVGQSLPRVNVRGSSDADRAFCGEVYEAAVAGLPGYEPDTVASLTELFDAHR